MVLTGPQTIAFFTDPAQMALLARTHTQLLTEGIATVDDWTRECRKSCFD